MRALRELLTGPPPALPDLLDRAAERWAGTPPRLRWAAAGVVTVAVLAVMGRGAVASPWGPPVEVLVAARDVPAGQPVTAADVAVASWPQALAADLASSVDEVIGAITTRPWAPGDPVRRSSLADGGLAALLPDGRAAVLVVDPAAPPATVGWWVDVVGQGYDGEAVVLARAARVLAATGQRLWLDVSRDDAPGVVAASARGDASLVLLPPREDSPPAAAR